MSCLVLIVVKSISEL